MTTRTPRHRGLRAAAATAVALSLAAGCGGDTGDAKTHPTRAGALLDAYGTEVTRVMARSSETTILGTTAPTVPTTTTTTTRPTTTTVTTTAPTTTPVSIQLPPGGGSPSVDFGSAPPPVTAPPATAAPTTTVPAPVVERVELLVRYYGQRRILVDGANLALYVDARDPGDGSSCGSWCTAQWLPVTGSVQFAGTGVDPVLIGAIVRADGVVQLTYGGRPLYRLAGEGPGTVAGQGAAGVWFVLDTTATPVFG